MTGGPLRAEAEAIIVKKLVGAAQSKGYCQTLTRLSGINAINS
ncbi:hypothetical protein ACVW0W_002882 [Bradyrhizobium sp. USDA 4469]